MIETSTITLEPGPVILGAQPPKQSELKSNGSHLWAACWLCDEVLITIRESPTSSAEAPYANSRKNGAASCRPYAVFSLDSMSNSKSVHKQILSIYVVPPTTRRSLTWRLFTHDGKRLTESEIEPAIVDLKTLLRKWLAPLSASTRNDVLMKLSCITTHHDLADCQGLTDHLLLLRDVLRPRMPELGVAASHRRGVHVDTLCRIDSRTFFIRGWAYSSRQPLQRLTVISPEGARVELLQRAFWHRRPDVDGVYGAPSEEADESKCGFVCYFETPAPSHRHSDWVLEAIDGDSREMETQIPKAIINLKEIQQILLDDLTHERFPAQRLRAEHILPALLRLDQRRQTSIKIDWSRQFGETPEQPRVSVVIPLYRRIDFLEYQMAQFSEDPEMGNVELIYMLDSPELSNELEQKSAGLYELYGLPFKVVALKQNAGFAGVNNVGAGLARGRYLLLLNSDVLPAAPGWLGRMTTFLEETPSAAAVGPKLLFEDETLQHAGLYFRRSPLSGLWENHHFFKGLDRHLPAANLRRRVPGVTGACLLLERCVYQELGGLRGVYIQGDYEDSDLCLRLRETGRDIWYLPEVELYHLEGQSYPSQDRARNYAMNQWMHSYLLGQQIDELMRPIDQTGESGQR